MNLAQAPVQYDKTDQDRMRGTLQVADKQNVKIGGPIIIQDANGKWWRLVVSTSGVLSTVAA